MTSDSQVTVHEVQMILHIKTWEGEGLLFMLLALEAHARKTYFPTISYLCQNIIWHIVAAIALFAIALILLASAVILI